MAAEGKGRGFFLSLWSHEWRLVSKGRSTVVTFNAASVDARVSPHPLCCGGVTAPPKGDPLAPWFRRHQSEARVVFGVIKQNPRLHLYQYSGPSRAASCIPCHTL